jgi:sugar/nucleoside kinase (ribokinase family)
MQISVIGDVLKDYWIEEMGILKMPIECYDYVLGGNLLNICKATVQLFDETIAIGNVHNDDYEKIIETLNDGKIVPLISSGTEQTGTCIIITENGIRKNLLTLKNANSYLELNNENREIVLRSDFLFITGNLFYPNNTKTSNICLSLLHEFRESKKKIVFDMLPHKIDKFSITQEYSKALENTNILISEIETFERFFTIDNLFSPIKGLDNIQLLLLFDMKQHLGICNNIRVYNMVTKSFFNEKISYNSRLSTKYYLDYIALATMLKHL